MTKIVYIREYNQKQFRDIKISSLKLLYLFHDTLKFIHYFSSLSGSKIHKLLCTKKLFVEVY